ncbi:hypothetical protein [Paenibacillus agilis]|uniref:Uncharacterized protein n=1 Tax=Paenibacillus agilis TaxID=3020863 RepID=A0A559ICZ3_9BACL|nr:hypothetical protein [Paenibacillus agilis]TVX85542.1 hypothetical protein FPZ44_24610 [Paenibacillus agilis]
MIVQIKETGNQATLGIIDSGTGVNFVTNFIGNTGALNDGQFTWDEDKKAYICLQKTYDWWKKVVSDNQALNDRIEELKEVHGAARVQEVVESADETDLEDYAAAVNRALDEAFE